MSDSKKIKKSDDPFAILEKIIEVGKKRGEVEISDKLKIVLETLGSDDEGEVFVNVEKYEGSEFLTKHKIETISYSMCEINGKSLREYEKLEDRKERETVKKETIDKIREIVSKWNDDLVSFVYNQYVVTVLESEQSLRELGILAPLPEPDENNQNEENSEKKETKQEENKEEKING